MSWMGTTLKILEHGFSIYRTKKAREYLKRVIDLRVIYEKEYNKPKNFRNNAIMDNVSIQLRLLAESFTALGKPKSGD